MRIGALPRSFPTRISCRPDRPVGNSAPCHALSRFSGAHPHVAVRLAVLHPGQRLWKGAPEHGSEVARFDACDMTDESEQVRASWNQRSAHVVLREPVKLPDHHLAGRLEILVKIGLGIQGRHGRSLPARSSVGEVPVGDRVRKRLHGATGRARALLASENAAKLATSGTTSTPSEPCA